MSAVAIRIDLAGFDRLALKVGELQARIPMVIAQGLNEGGDKVRTQVMRTLWKQTGLTKYGSVTSRIRTSRGFAEGSRHTDAEAQAMNSLGAVARSQGAALTYQIIAPGKPPIPITEWPVSVATGPGGRVHARTWGVDHAFKRSFQEAGGALRARTTSKRHPLRKLYGPSLAKELVSEKGSVPAVFYATVSAEVLPAIAKRLARVL